MAGASDPRFADVERQYYALKARLSGGQLTREQFEAALQKLMILDAQSRYWMMGAETGKWYVYDGQNWQQGEPPSSAVPAAPPAAASATATQSDSATLASFTPPAAAGPLTPDSAPTMSFTPPAERSTPVTPDAAPTMTFTPPTQKSGEAQPDSALTMASFAPPAASKVPLDRAATMAAFTPQKVAATGTTPLVRAVPAAAAGGRKLSPLLLLGCLFALVCLGGIVALGFAVNSRFGNAPNLATPVAVVTAATTATTAAAATDTPALLNTSVPAATATSAPTRTPLPAPTSTRTVQPQPSSPVVSPATATPSQTPEPATPTSEPTATDTPAPAPTRSPRPAVEFPVSFSYVGYEKWGRPNGDCTQFNNKDAVRQFKWEETVTNRTTTTVASADWGMPAVANNEGTQSPVCGYGAPDIPPGQTAKATFAAYVALNQYVQRIQHQVRNTTYIRCLDASAKEVTC